MIKMRKLDSKIFLIGIVFLFLPLFVSAVSTGEEVLFYIDSKYDFQEKENTTAFLKKTTPRAYFFIDSIWWDSLSVQERGDNNNALETLSSEFEATIYPTLTSIYGSEWSPGIDQDTRITILFHPMKEEAGGYFNAGDEYPKAQNPASNEREMIYINIQFLNSHLVKGFVAHEFVHLITFNQKEKIYGVTEEIWLNEARAEYASALLGYDDVYKGSNLERRVKNFLDKPYDSLTEWQNLPFDYGVVNLFIRYLVDHYGINVLSQSLKFPQVGISSLNFTLTQLGFKENFAQIFTDWTIAVFLNDCEISQRYCYLNSNLKNFKLIPLTNFIPFTGESTLSVNNITKDWAGNWFKFIGGHDTLKIEFNGAPEAKFKMPYVINDYLGGISVNFVEIDTEGKGTIYISDFGTKNTSVIIMPIAQNKSSDFSNLETSYQFSWTASTIKEIQTSPESELVKSLLAQIAVLEEEIAKIQSKITAILAERTSCEKLENNLYYGMKDDSEVECLQEFLSYQGEEIYPEGLITGFFGNLTHQAIIRFQEKYADEILTPLDLSVGTGFVGFSTRAKINSLLE